jgi:polyhydroxyalkanoate synthesis regulator phasin
MGRERKPTMSDDGREHNIFCTEYRATGTDERGPCVCRKPDREPDEMGSLGRCCPDEVERADCKYEHCPCVHPLRQQVERLELHKQAAPILQERIGELEQQVERLELHVNDLQSGMYINCVYCGHRYGPADSHAATVKDGKPMAEALREHISVCPEHPLSHATQQVERLEREVSRARAALFNKETEINELSVWLCDKYGDENVPDTGDLCEIARWLSNDGDDKDELRTRAETAERQLAEVREEVETVCDAYGDKGWAKTDMVIRLRKVLAIRRGE